MRIPVQFLGQSGWKMSFGQTTIYIDPYLSNSVQELDSSDLKRLRKIPMSAESVTDADYILITHEHIDHCDPHTLPIISETSPNSIFIGPKPVIEILKNWGIESSRLILAKEKWIELGDSGIKIHATPAAHLEIVRDDFGNLSYAGFVIQYYEKKIFIAGDTCVNDEILREVSKFSPIHTAILPVNEHNFYRAKRGIVGNMSVREAFQFALDIKAKNVIAVHWDMFEVNSAYPEEIQLVYDKLKPNFNLHISPSFINLSETNISIIIRTLNESRHLNELLRSIRDQETRNLGVEIVVVDSGSTDGTLEIAKQHHCRIIHINREEFSFGRSLNMGCASAEGDVIAITSGHCVPVNKFWLHNLCQPIYEGLAEYTYGRQIGNEHSHFSECRIFAKYFPEQSQLPQEGYFCNNANSAILRNTWAAFQFDEELTGLEDMELAQRLVERGGKVAYVADAGVYHYHSESWAQVRRRFERESIALQKIMPQLHVNFADTVRYIVTSVVKDVKAARKLPHPRSSLKNILLYRWNQYIGSWKGNKQHRKLSHAEKDQYFYPH